MAGAVSLADKGAVDRRRLVEHIRLLGRCGAGLQAIAGPLTLALRDLIGAASGAIFWVDGQGIPAGFFHDCAPVELKDFYVKQYDELFGLPGQITMLTFIDGQGRAIGTALDDGFMDRWLDGNIHRYLCEPLGHHHFLDMRLNREGSGRAAWFAWNPESRPFTQIDVARLETVQHVVERALVVDEATVRWHAVGEGNGHFLTDLSGEKLIAIHPEAEAFLKEAHLLKQNVPMTGDLVEAPLFAAMLAVQLRRQSSAHFNLPIANGRLVARASLTRLVQPGNEHDLIYVALGREAAVAALAVERVMALALTPLQREIALFAMTGGKRDQCEAEFGVSSEALKKHVRAIYSVTGTATWRELATLLE